MLTGEKKAQSPECIYIQTEESKREEMTKLELTEFSTVFW